VGVLRRLRHGNLLELLGISAGRDTVTLLTPLMSRGSLYSFLRNTCRGRPPPLKLSLRLLTDTASGMAYLHSCSPRVVHRDLKSSNILLGSDYAVKIADFGLSREVHQTHAMSRVGTLQWVAPEVLLGQKYSHKCDAWSFGVVIWELLTAMVPFDGLDRNELARKVALEGLRLPPPPGTPRRLLVLIARCFDKPRGRPEFAKVVTELRSIAAAAEAAEAAEAGRGA